MDGKRHIGAENMDIHGYRRTEESEEGEGAGGTIWMK